MAGVGFHAATGEVAISTSAITLIQVVAAANHGLLISEWSVAFQGVDATDAPIWVRLMRQADAGTMSSLTPVKNPDDTDETLQVTAQHTATSEPTYGNVLYSTYVHPQHGFVWQARHGEEIKVGGGDRLGIVVLADDASVAAATIIGTE